MHMNSTAVGVDSSAVGQQNSEQNWQQDSVDQSMTDQQVMPNRELEHREEATCVYENKPLRVVFNYAFIEYGVCVIEMASVGYACMGLAHLPATSGAVAQPVTLPPPPPTSRHDRIQHQAAHLRSPPPANPQLPLSNDGQRSDARPQSPRPPAATPPNTHQQINDPDSDLGSSSPM
ncbi:hypothetical protein ACLOJK_026948 [Asimina triloba]